MDVLNSLIGLVVFCSIAGYFAYKQGLIPKDILERFKKK